MYGDLSDYAGSVDQTMIIIVGISVVLLLGVTAAMIYFVIKYNRKRHPKAKQIHGNIGLEVLWIGVPTVLVLIMFWYGFKGFKELRETADIAMTVNVTGRMWEWTFTYENGAQTDTLYIPANSATKLEMKSEDVNHSFYIPAFRLKEDVIASRYTYMILTPKDTGRYDIACAEYCGLRHSYMYTEVVVMEPEEFDQWYASLDAEEEKLPGSETVPGTPDDTTKTDSDETLADTAAADQQTKQEAKDRIAQFQHTKDLLFQKGCVACHSFDGSRKIGPSFLKLARKMAIVITDGEERRVKIDEEYIKKSIIDPNADIVKGYPKFSMTDYSGRLTEKELEDIVK